MPTPFSFNDTIMAVSAFRYCLGQQTYVVGACIEWLTDHWPRIPRDQQWVILWEIVEALQDAVVGTEMDERAWREFLVWGFQQDAGALSWIHDQTAHKKKPFPISVSTVCHGCGQPPHTCLCSHEEDTE